MRQEAIEVALNAGTYYICTCGRSKNAPHCDGSHQGTSFQPLVLQLDSPQQVEISDLLQS